MSLSDPTSGAGYAFGQKLPSTHMTTIATQQPDALDIVNGGTYTNLTNITINNDTFIRHLYLAGMKLFIQAAAQLDSTLVIATLLGGEITWDVAKSVRRLQSLNPRSISQNGGSDDWAFDSAAGPATLWQVWVTTGSSTRPDCYIPADNLIHGATISQWGAKVYCASSGANAANVPRLSLYYRDITNITGTQPAATQIGSTQSFGSYRNGISAQAGSGASHVVDVENRRYWFYLEGESGANAVTGVGIYHLQITHSVAGLSST